MKAVLLLSITFIAFSCSTVQKEIPEIKISGNSVGSDSLYIHPWEAFIYDSLILITAVHEDKPIYIFNKYNYEFLGSSGVLGKGPGELNGVASSSLNREKKELWILESGSNHIACYPLDSLLANKNYLYKKHITFNRFFDMFNTGLHVYNENDYIISGISREGIAIRVQNGEIIDTIGSLIENHSKSGIDDERMFYMRVVNSATISPDGGHCAIGYAHFDRISFYDLENNEHLSTHIGDESIEPVMLKNGMVNTNRSYRMYSGGYADDQYFYIQYTNKPLFKNADHKSAYGVVSTMPDKIRVFDFTGRLIKQIKLDIGVFRFVIDKERNLLIGIGNEDDIDALLFREYDFGGI